MKTTIEKRGNHFVAHRNGQKIRFWVADASEKYPNDRYSILVDFEISPRAPEVIPYMAMNSLGMYYHGEVDRSYVAALLAGDHSAVDRLVGWDDLPLGCKASVLRDLEGYFDSLYALAS
jgi:hypothetical protein